MTEYIIKLDEPWRLTRDSYVQEDLSEPSGWRHTGLQDLAKRFGSMTEAALFCFGLDRKTEIVPVSDDKQSKTKEKLCA